MFELKFASQSRSQCPHRPLLWYKLMNCTTLTPLFTLPALADDSDPSLYCAVSVIVIGVFL